PEARARVASCSAMVEAARRPPAALAATAAHKGRAASVPAASVSAKAGALGAPATLAAPAARVAWARRAQVARAPPARPGSVAVVADQMMPPPMEAPTEIGDAATPPARRAARCSAGHRSSVAVRRNGRQAGRQLER